MKIDHQLKHEFNSVTSNAYFGIHFFVYLFSIYFFSMQSNFNLVTAVISIIIVAHKNIYAFIAFNNKFHLFFFSLIIFMFVCFFVVVVNNRLLCSVCFPFDFHCICKKSIGCLNVYVQKLQHLLICFLGWRSGFSTV